MNELTKALKLLVASFTPEQRQILKDGVHNAVDAYSELPGFILSPVKNAIDKSLDRFLDDTK